MLLGVPHSVPVVHAESLSLAHGHEPVAGGSTSASPVDSGSDQSSAVDNSNQGAHPSFHSSP